MIEDWYENTLKSEYKLVKVLKCNEHKQIKVLRNRQIGKDIVKLQHKGTDEVYSVLKGLGHQNIVRVHESYYMSQDIVVLEEYIDGQTITDILEIGLIQPIGVARIISSLCDALDVLHSKRIIHRDIKPENVMVNRNGVVKLIDFDAAKLYKPYQSGDTVFAGTTGYAAPEQFGINQSDERTDIFALGVLMNVMFTGEHPSRKMYKGRQSEIIKKCIHVDPNERYQNVKSLREQLSVCKT